MQLAEDTLRNLSSLDGKSTQRWDRLSTLVRMVRSGDRSSGVPAYNGSLFAADGFPGSALLERVKITDNHLGPALVAIAYEGDNPDAPGLDFAGFQIDHLGSIYESLLALRLSRAPEDLVYDTKGDIFRPRRSDDKMEVEVTKAQLYYQSEAGGRKSGWRVLHPAGVRGAPAQPFPESCARGSSRGSEAELPLATPRRRHGVCLNSPSWIRPWGVPTS